MFFLWTSKGGITWITGLTQGLFSVAPGDASTDRLATRSASRELMLDPDTSRPVKDNALSMRLSALRSRIASHTGGARRGEIMRATRFARLCTCRHRAAPWELRRKPIITTYTT